MSFPVNDNLVYVDGSTSNLTLIDFTKGIVKSQFIVICLGCIILLRRQGKEIEKG